MKKKSEPSNSTTTIDGNPVYKVIYSNRAAQEDDSGNMIEEGGLVRGEKKQEEEQQGIGLTNMTIWTVKNDKIYEITYSAQRENFNDYSSVIKKMISSIQFIDPSSFI